MRRAARAARRCWVRHRPVGARGHVWAFEPLPEWREQSAWHVRENGFGARVTLVDVALSSSGGERDITRDTASATFHPSGWTGPTTRVRLRRLDDLDLPRVDFVKVDIDGHEPAFLEGAEATLRRDRPAMVMEFSQANLDAAGSGVEALRARLEALGYVLHSERTWRPFASRLEFLRECGNYSHSANVWAFPRGTTPPRQV